MLMLSDNAIENSIGVVPEGPEHPLGFTTIVSGGEKEIIIQLQIYLTSVCARLFTARTSVCAVVLGNGMCGGNEDNLHSPVHE